MLLKGVHETEKEEIPPKSFYETNIYRQAFNKKSNLYITTLMSIYASFLYNIANAIPKYTNAFKKNGHWSGSC